MKNDVPPISRSQKLVVVAVLLIAAVFLFGRLGHYALWDDEAGTALTALGVCRTGDTSVMLGHNVALYEGGKDVRNLHERYMPPLPAYLAAPFIGLLGQTAGAARLPFALCGWLCVAVMIWWLRRAKADTNTWIIAALAILTNVSLFLFLRQCRYFALAMVSTTALAYLYVNWDHRRRTLIAFVIASLVLLTSNYLNFVAFYICLAVDFAGGGRKRIKLGRSEWLILLWPLVLVGAVVGSIWNPARLMQAVEPYEVASRPLYFWWCLRDSFACEFGVVAFIILPLILYRWNRNPWLLRAPLLLLLYMFVISLLVPRPPLLREVAAVRYIAPVIPLFIAIEVLGLAALGARQKWLAIGLAVVGFSTNLLNGGPLLAGGLHSTIGRFAGELRHPPSDPYRVTAGWINQHVADRQSVWVLPDFATYPLMYHAPQPIYAWQLRRPTQPQFDRLDPIHFIGEVPPDYIIAFGPLAEVAMDSIKSWGRADIAYEKIETLDFYWREQHRPELFWRTFEANKDFNRDTDAIYIFKLAGRPLSK